MNRTEKHEEIRKKMDAIIYSIALKEANGDVGKVIKTQTDYVMYIVDEQNRFIDNIIKEFDEEEKDEIYCMTIDEIINDVFSDNDFNNFMKMLEELLVMFNNDLNCEGYKNDK